MDHDQLAKLLDSNLSEEDVLIIWDFVRSYVRLTPEEETTVNEVIEREQKRGRRQRLTWSQQERLKALQEMLTQLLAQKFGPLPGEVQARIEALGLDDVQTTLTHLLAAESLADLGLAEEGRRTAPSPAGTA